MSSVLGDGLIPGLFDSLDNYTALYRLTKRDVRDADAIVPLKKQSAEAFRANPFKMEAWTSLKRPLKDTDAEKLAKQLDTLFTQREKSKEEWAKALAAAEGTADWKSDKAWVEILKQVALAYGQVAQKKVNGKPNAFSLDTFNAAVAAPESVDKEAAFFKSVMTDYTIPQQMEVIAKLYCEAMKENKELQVLTNDLNLPLLLDSIETASGKKILIKVRQANFDYETQGGQLLPDKKPLPMPKVIEVGRPPGG